MSRAPFVIAALLAAAALIGCADGTKQGDDLPPMIVDSYAEDGERIELEDEVTVVWVTVFDEDMAGLEYVWVTSEWGLVPYELIGDNPEGSQVTLDRDLRQALQTFDGQELTFQVTDSSGNSTRLDWPLFIRD